MAHFEVGGKVIAIANHQRGHIKRGDVFDLDAIKKGCCTNAPLLLLISMPYAHALSFCPCCNKRNPIGEPWFDSRCFLPYDTSLSTLTVEQLLETELQTI